MLQRLCVAALSVSVAVTSGCEYPRSDLKRSEVSLLSALVQEECSGKRPVVIQADLGTGGWEAAGDPDYARRESELVTEELVQDFIKRNEKQLDLRAIMPEPLGCRFLVRSEMDDIELPGFEQVLPPPNEPRRDTRPVLIYLSRPGFNRDGTLALVRFAWAGGFGSCLGRFRVFKNQNDGWVQRAEVQYLIC